jgi:hypothetical protein
MFPLGAVDVPVVSLQSPGLHVLPSHFSPGLHGVQALPPHCFEVLDALVVTAVFVPVVLLGTATVLAVQELEQPDDCLTQVLPHFALSLLGQHLSQAIAEPNKVKANAHATNRIIIEVNFFI